jgi:hypothetical protein
MKKFINILVGLSLVANTGGLVALAQESVDGGDGATAVAQVREAVKDQRQDVREAAKVNIDAAKDVFKAQVKTAREELEVKNKASREEFKTKLEAARTELKTKREMQKEELKARLATIKDERKKQTVERLDNRFSEINQKLVNHWIDVLDRLAEHLKKISVRADELATAGKDVAAVRTAVQKAETAIAEARTALIAQQAKTYPIKVTNETALKSAVSVAREALNKDLKAVKELVRVAHKAVVDALHALNQVRGEKEKEATTTQQSQ